MVVFQHNLKKAAQNNTVPKNIKKQKKAQKMGLAQKKFERQKSTESLNRFENLEKMGNFSQSIWKWKIPNRAVTDPNKKIFQNFKNFNCVMKKNNIHGKTFLGELHYL